VHTQFIFALLSLLITFNLMGYEVMHEKTPVGEIKVLQLPARTALEASSERSYFEENNGLFRTLFRYISKHDLSMTTPVEADIKPGKMRFFVGNADAGKSRPNTSSVTVKNLQPTLVVAIGIRGSYSEENFEENRDKLEKWVEVNEKHQPSGTPAYGVYWDGPFTPWFLKRSEVHVPILPLPILSDSNQPTDNP
jgi:effector-binding domain-containing protein